MEKLELISSQVLKNELKKRGYFVDNLWTTEDVQSKFNCTEDEAQEVLEQALTNDATMEQIWLAIEFHGEDNELEVGAGYHLSQKQLPIKKIGMMGM